MDRERTPPASVPVSQCSGQPVFLSVSVPVGRVPLGVLVPVSRAFRRARRLSRPGRARGARVRASPHGAPARSMHVRQLGRM